MSRSTLTLSAIVGAVVLVGSLDPYWPECWGFDACRPDPAPGQMRGDLRNLVSAQESYFADAAQRRVEVIERAYPELSRRQLWALASDPPPTRWPSLYRQVQSIPDLPVDGYARSIADLEYTASANITVEIVAASDSAWRAVASHSRTARTCTVFMGTVPQPPATVEGEPACRCPEPRGFWEWLHGRSADC